MAESQQKKLDRVRRPRVQITYEVETNGAMEKKELPFVVGVLADLSAATKTPLKPLKDRKFTNIDRDNINDVLAGAPPRVAMKVDNKLTGEGDTKMAVELNFKHLDDFEPTKVAEQVPALKELLEMRQKLTYLQSKMEGNDKVEELLADVLANTEKAVAALKGQTARSAEVTSRSTQVGWHALRYSEGRAHLETMAGVAAKRCDRLWVSTPFGVPQGVPPKIALFCLKQRRSLER